MIRFFLILLASYFSASVPRALAVDVKNAIRLSSHHISTNVSSRLMKTSITMVFENSEDCSFVHGITLQLPRNARVKNLATILSDGCELSSEVKTVEDAVSDFREFSSGGKAAALLTAWDMSNYDLSVSIPPFGTTSVVLEYEELLFQKLDQVSFQVPLFPGIAVDDLQLDVSVEEPNIGVIELMTDLEDESNEIVLDNNKASMHYEKREVTSETSLPSLLQAHFRSGPLPQDGLFLSDGECFTHVFNPDAFLSGVGSMARKIVFVIDVSGSMGGQKLEDAKASFSVMIDSLNERDTLFIQPFSNKGTESLWGPKPATPENKADAKAYVETLRTIGSTNLNQAFLDGIQNVYDAPETVAPILVILTDGKGNSGARDIARNVRERNEGGKVKIFSLAFGENADINLLLGISIQNGGRTFRIYEGFGDASDQMELFYKQELGSILMSDVSVSYDFGETGLLESTVQQFPVFAAGSEIVVRGKMNPATVMDASRSLKSLVSFNSAVGPQEWQVDNIVIPENSAGDCRQSFAQARIVELLEYRDAERSLGDELFATAVSRSTNLATLSFEEEARKIALDAQLVWPGLTALITVENASCQQNSANVCSSGVGNDVYDAFEDESEFFAADSPMSDSMMASPTAPAKGSMKTPGMNMDMDSNMEWGVYTASSAAPGTSHSGLYSSLLIFTILCLASLLVNIMV